MKYNKLSKTELQNIYGGGWVKSALKKFPPGALALDAWNHGDQIMDGAKKGSKTNLYKDLNV